MASGGDSNFQWNPPLLRRQPSLPAAWRNYSGVQSSRRRDDELEGKNCAMREQKGLLDIDLNVVPPEGDGSESSADDGGGILFRVASDVVSFAGESELSVGENRTGIRSNSLNGEATKVFGMDPIEERRNRRWSALLEVVECSSLERVETRSRKRGVEISELRITTRKSSTAHRRHSLDGNYVEAAVVRSTRGRALALPNKYRDSVFVTAAEKPRHNRSNKYATGKRNSR